MKLELFFILETVLVYILELLPLSILGGSAES